MTFTYCLHSEALLNTDLTRIGIFSNFNFNSHDADFKKLPDCPSCSPGYEKGSGTGLTFGVLFEYPFSSFFRAGLRASFNDHSGLLTRTEETTIFYEGEKDVAGRFEHRLEANIRTFGFEPYTQFRIIQNLYVGVGFYLGFTSTASYSQVEKLVFPTGSGTFLDSNGNDTKKRSRNEFSGDIKNASSTFLSIGGGISYEVPLNKERTILAEPRINYALGLSNIVNSIEVPKWSVNSFSAGIALKYVFRSKPETFKKYEKIERIDTIRKESESITVQLFAQGIVNRKTEVTQNENVELTTETFQRTDTIFVPVIVDLKPFITAVGVDSSGTEIQEPIFKIEEFLSTKIQPILNYLFFDEGSSVIPPRYEQLNKAETAVFKESNLFHNTTLQTYYDLLNVIGNRMAKKPDYKITLIGCNDGYSIEKDDGNLSRKRAEAVRDYLNHTWNISNDRISIETRNLPDKPSTPIQDPDKLEENRRVELYSDNDDLLKPIQYTDTMRVITPPTVRFKTDIISTNSVKNADIIVKNGDKVIKVIKSNAIAGKYTDWKLDEDIIIMKNVSNDLKYKLTVKDSKDNITSTNEKTIQFKVTTIKQKKKEKKGDKEIDRYSLILFDFDKADLEKNNLKIINDIKQKIKSTSDIYITGHTDRTGEDSYNLRLSIERAFATKKALGFPKAIAEGMGEKIILHDNDLPEGRFFCRTVNIIVETKLK